MENYLNYSDEKLVSVYNTLKTDLETEKTQGDGSDLAIKVYVNLIAKIKTELINRNINY